MDKFGWTLSSDGSKSSYEIGVWKALRELKIDVSVVSGSFCGAINAALIAQGDFRNAVGFWRTLYSKNLLKATRLISQKYTKEWSQSDIRSFKKGYIKLMQSNIFELTDIKNTIEQYIDENVIRESKTMLGIGLVSLDSFEPMTITINKIPKGKLSSYLLNALCFPQIALLDMASSNIKKANEASSINVLDRLKLNNIISTEPTDDKLEQISTYDDVRIIKSNQLFMIDFEEVPNDSKRKIKLGYIDTLRKFDKSIGNTFMIEYDLTNSKFDRFKDKFGCKLNERYSNILKFLLQIQSLDKAEIVKTVKTLLYNVRIEEKSEDTFYIDLIENIAKILRIEKEERYTIDSLITHISEKSMGLMASVLQTYKNGLTSADDIRELLNNVGEPINTIPDETMFIDYFLIIRSMNINNFAKFEGLVRALSPKTIIAIVSMIYLLHMQGPHWLIWTFIKRASFKILTLFYIAFYLIIISQDIPLAHKSISSKNYALFTISYPT